MFEGVLTMFNPSSKKKYEVRKARILKICQLLILRRLLRYVHMFFYALHIKQISTEH